MTTIANPKPLQSKSRSHTVAQTSEQTFEVTSGTSSSLYYVTQLQAGGMICSCKWGQYRRSSDPRSGCSHVQSVFTFIKGKNSYAWNSQEQAKKQHRPIVMVGDGVILTVG